MPIRKMKVAHHTAYIAALFVSYLMTGNTVYAQLNWRATDAGITHHEAPYLLPDSIRRLPYKELRANYWSYLSRDKEAVGTYAAASGPTNQIALAEGKTLAPAPAAIYAAASDTRIVIVNEAHHLPHHRGFTRSLLRELYELGYRHLGLEALINHPEFRRPLDTLPYPSFRDGYYVREPELADLIRSAKQIGYKVFGYERMGREPQPTREIIQATHIATYMAGYPFDKVLIHAGYDHAREGRMTNDWEYAMAQRLKDMTGIDPLTIDQVSLAQHPAIDRPMVAKQAQGCYRPEADSLNYMDLYVIHPAYGDTLGRPGWKAAPDREAVAVDLRQVPATPPYLVAAYAPGVDVQTAVPVDLVAVEQATDTITLFLPEEVTTLILHAKDQQTWSATLER